MQRYYRTAKAVSQLNTILLQNLDARITPPRDKAVPRRSTSASACATSCSQRATSDCSSASRARCSRAFLLLQQHPELKGMTAPHAARAVARAPPDRRRRSAAIPRNRARFMQILRSRAASCTSCGA